MKLLPSSLGLMVLVGSLLLQLLHPSTAAGLSPGLKDLGCTPFMRTEQQELRKASDPSNYHFDFVRELAQKEYPECGTFPSATCSGRLEEIADKVSGLIAKMQPRELLETLGVQPMELCKNIVRVKDCFIERKISGTALTEFPKSSEIQVSESDSRCAALVYKLGKIAKTVLAPKGVALLLENLSAHPTVHYTSSSLQRTKRDEDEGGYHGETGNDVGGFGSDGGNDSGNYDPGTFPDVPEDPSNNYLDNEDGGPPIDFGYTDVDAENLSDEPGFIVAIALFISVGLFILVGVALAVREKVRKERFTTVQPH